MVKKAKTTLHNKEHKKLNMISSLTKKCMGQPALLYKLKIDLCKHSVIKRLLVLINPEEPVALVSVTQDSYFCLEDIFSVQNWDLKKMASWDWQRTPSFRDYLDALYLHIQINEKNWIVKKQNGKTFIHRLIAIEAARYRSPSLSVTFNEIINDFFSKTVGSAEQRCSSVILSESQVKSHPLYKMLSVENQNLKQLNSGTSKLFHKFSKEKQQIILFSFRIQKIIS